MPDTKISALTSATTPLVGTEVLPIVQSGATKKVSVADLTVGRAVSASSLVLTGSPLLIASGGTGLSSYTAGDLVYYASGTTLTKLGIGTAYQALQVNAGGTAPSWQPSASSVLTAQGDLLYASAANTLARLAKNTTATRYLANTGSSNNPQWDQVNLANGVTGTLPVANGGTGTATTFTAGSVVFAGASGVFSQNNTQFFWDNTNNRLGIGTAVPGYPLQIARSGLAAYLANTDGTGTLLSGVNGSGLGLYGTFSNTDVAFFANSAERARITAAGNVVAGGSAALATNATNGFLYVPTCAGTPTGTPTAITGMAPIVVNTTNNKLFFYSGGAWRDAGP